MSKHLPIVLLAMLMIITLWGAEAPVGAWKVNSARSTWTGDPRLKSLIVRFQGPGRRLVLEKQQKGT